MRNKLLFVLLLPFFSISQSYEKITVGAGPEDFVLDTFQGNERLIISCDERRDKDSIVQGDIWTLDIKTN